RRGPRSGSGRARASVRDGLRRRRRRALPQRPRAVRSRGAGGRGRPSHSARAFPRCVGRRARPCRRDRADLPARPRRGAERERLMTTIQLRRLGLADLDAIERIEKRSYPTPWSRSMFAGELAKPSSICLGAFEESGELLGYLIISRYVDAWHVMNVAVEPEHRRRGIATTLLDRPFELTADD